VDNEPDGEGDPIKIEEGREDGKEFKTRTPYENEYVQQRSLPNNLMCISPDGISSINQQKGISHGPTAQSNEIEQIVKQIQGKNTPNKFVTRQNATDELDEVNRSQDTSREYSGIMGRNPLDKFAKVMN
jgi:hypothetical protein